MYVIPNICKETALTLVGKGWQALLLQFYDAIKNNPNNVRVVQVKEKFGGLRIYFDHKCSDEDNPNFKCTHNFDHLHELADKLSEQSYKTCERCGAPGEVRSQQVWIKTLCNDCVSKGRSS